MALLNYTQTKPIANFTKRPPTLFLSNFGRYLFVIIIFVITFHFNSHSSSDLGNKQYADKERVCKRMKKFI